MCVSINANRATAMLTLNVLNQFTTAYMDGFFDCETRNSNTDGTGIDYFGMSSTYALGGHLGKFGKQTFLGIASLFS
ncbi:hypothetical protein CAEBREN_03681 [Caenorhabditis brenneri]|uniref:Uncharacterized protein n=1 Tax=Caenorhabditis brenneri TaxID=135651 RepID=G0ML95_CAEBE|nr:hypothetical protein CAEBREN_03681 [Caenorhabditis brenneri]